MTIPEFIGRCDRYCETRGVTRVWLSKRLFADTNRLNDLASGTSDVGVKRLARAVADLLQLEDINPASSRSTSDPGAAPPAGQLAKPGGVQ